MHTKTIFITIAHFTNVEAESIYSKYKIMSSYLGDKISAGKILFTIYVNHPTDLECIIFKHKQTND